MRLLLLFALFSVTNALVAGDPAPWPRWRGPSDNGSTAQGSYPLKWDAEHVKWKTPLPGNGCSTPIVLEHRIFLTAPVEAGRSLAFDWEGRSRRKSLTRAGGQTPKQFRMQSFLGHGRCERVCLLQERNFAALDLA
jgi:hypothetical protein